MDAATLDILPEAVRHFYTARNVGKTTFTDGERVNAQALAAKTKFETLQKTEALKEEIRLNSNLYKIFGENLFQCMTVEKQIHLDFQCFIPDAMFKKLARSAEHTALMKHEIQHAGDDELIVKYDPEKESELPKSFAATFKHEMKREAVVTDDTLYVPFVSEVLAQALEVELESIMEAAVELDKLFPADTDRSKVVCLTQKNYSHVVAMNRMLDVFDKKKLPIVTRYYFRHTLKYKELDHSIASINWPKEQYILEYADGQKQAS